GSDPPGRTGPAGPVKIGVIGPLSGLGASIGHDMSAGVQIAVNELNASGGVLGHQIEVIQRDNQGIPAQTPQIARDLIDQEHVSMLVGPPGITSWLAIKQLIDQAHVIDFPIMTDPYLKTHVDPWTFRLMIPDELEI